MTKKDYERIARAIRNSVVSSTAGKLGTLRDVALSISIELQANNFRFDRERFLAACGLGKEVV